MVSVMLFPFMLCVGQFMDLFVLCELYGEAISNVFGLCLLFCC